MKLVVVGVGQCGCRIADEFARLNKMARLQRHIEIIPGIFAVNTDAADLSGLRYIKSDYKYRILIGGRLTGGHGVGKINELGAQIAKSDGDKIIDSMRGVKELFEADAFLIIASSGGGTGSGGVGVVANLLKERFHDMPIYTLVVLPFEHEQETEERSVYNTATCLKTVSSVSDAVFLVDNQRFVSKDFSIAGNLSKINTLIAAPFYNVLCAGEEKRPKYIGGKTLDAGDIMATISGWTVIGYGKVETPLMHMPWERTRHFINKSRETHKGIQAMDEAIGDLSLSCNPADAGRALHLLTAQSKEMNIELVKELGDYMRELAPQAIIRSGDYPRTKGRLEVTVILSELKNVDKVKKYFERSTRYIPEIKKRQEEIDIQLKGIEDAAKDIPSLL
ncbi:MAG: tubulin/FtsZ family protein [Chloroflexota bacterium]